MKNILKIAATLFVVVVVAALALPLFINAESFRPRLESELTTALGRDVRLGKLDFSISSGSVTAQDVAIADDPAFSTQPFVQAKSLNIGVELVPLIFSKEVHVTDLTIDHPEIALVQSATDKWNFSSLGGKNAAKAPTTKGGNSAANPDLSVNKLRIKGGRVSVAKVNGKSHVYDSVDIAVKNFSFAAEFPFTLTANLPGGGSLQLDGKAGPIDPSDAALTPLFARLDVKHLDLAASGFVDPSTGMAGVADFDGTVSSDGKEAKSSGTILADRLKLSSKGAAANRSVQVKYSIQHDLEKKHGALTQGDIAIGRAQAHLTGNYVIHGEANDLNMRLDGENMPLDELEAMLPALGITLPPGSSLKGGTLSTTLAITGPTTGLVITGPVRLANTKLAGFDLGSKLSAISALGGTKTGSDTSIQNLSANARVAPDGIRTDNVNLIIPALGEVTGDGTISPGGELNYKLNAAISGGVVGGLTQMAAMGSKGAAIPFFVRGTTSNPRFEPDLQGMARGELKSALSGMTGAGKSGKSATDALGSLFGKKKKN